LRKRGPRHNDGASTFPTNAPPAGFVVNSKVTLPFPDA